ncbi:ectoine/hydroxyectoine ABC transporter substrate-binding protein EhuB [Pseudorhizobium flavum]|uniref:Polar amino acid transport system substrate-binding protein n=1 Tax=Pseudorhizobium flavum TaxID=1335061 RepID=A0A7X0DET4_9HYPH|nr:ectoine/hydroxyectoine ABC transporter substrate-binding protein EhuB [Pseudorhizobium flavum]MBB6182252.1 polar amino acid transport system substrate-binding protein [Pseudorhizobium flavum]CAD6629296.1 ectoine/hydroxyectoine ABC transporter substrate-binding protein EhuB [Pseudorhizobium flavum]
MHTGFENFIRSSVIAATASAATFSGTHAATLEQIKSQGYVRAATANEVPYGYMDTDGKAKGIAPEVAEAVLKTMGITDVQWVVTPFGSLIPGLKANRFDMVAAEQDILPARCEQVLFSEPNSSYGDGLLVPKGNPKNIHSYEDIAKNGDLKLAVVNGTSHLTFAEGVGVPEDQLVVLANNADAPATVSSARADAYAATEATITSLAKEGSDLELAAPFSDPVVKGKTMRSFGGFAFSQDANDFVAEFNKALVEFKTTDEYKKILTTYGISESSIAASLAKKTADLCAGQ